MNFTICSSYTPLSEHGGDLVKDLTGKCKFINYLRNCLPLFFFESILLHAIEMNYAILPILPKRKIVNVDLNFLLREKMDLDIYRIIVDLITIKYWEERSNVTFLKNDI
jgi:hypothetical protein